LAEQRTHNPEVRRFDPGRRYHDGMTAEYITCNSPWPHTPGVIHEAGNADVFGGFYQECARCGHVIQDYTGVMEVTPSPWPEGSLISIGPGRPAFRYLPGEPAHADDTLCVN
jgi:hypothetical protein